MIEAAAAASRPLRALVVVLGGWTTVRVVALWPSPIADVAQSDPPSPQPALPVLTQRFDDAAPPFRPRPQRIASAPVRALEKRRNLPATTAHGNEPVFANAAPIRASIVRIAGAVQTTSATTVADDGIAEPPRALVSTPFAPGLPAQVTENRFSGSAWALLRDDSSRTLATGGQLGGSQAGVRLFYTPGPKALAVTARISTPLAQASGREAALGIAVRGRNVGVIVEQRLALDRAGRDAPAVIAYGGVSDVAIPGGTKLDGYVQAGAVGIARPAAFIDGALRVERTIAGADKARLAVGAGTWGGAQPGAARLDVGPQVVAHLPVGPTNLRISAEWRQRIAGDAAPASGPSVTVGFDF